MSIIPTDVLTGEDRLSMANRLLSRYPDRIPVICKQSSTSNTDTPKIEKTKFLVSRELTVGQFIHVVRTRIEMPAEKALFFFVNDNIIPKTSENIFSIYEQYKSNDNLLYVTYTSENTFG